MKLIATHIPDVKIIEPEIWRDERGFFMETLRADWFEREVAAVQFVQHNHSQSKRGVLRGLHHQLCHSQGKLVRVVSGEVLDVAVDLRLSSPTFGSWVSARLSAENGRQLWIPQGFAHGFYVLSDVADVLYQCTDYYHSQSEVVLRWNDEDIAVDWQLSGEPLLSLKDKQGLPFLDVCRILIDYCV